MADRVLVVDDEQSLRKILAATLQREGYEVEVASDGEEAIAALDRDGADVVVTDLVMPRMDGLTLLRKVVARHPDVPVIVVTAHGRIDSAVEAMKAGAFDFLAKVSDAPSTVLIQGESGTGKELVATALHETSVRRDRPFIKINCAAIPREVVEAEL